MFFFLSISIQGGYCETNQSISNPCNFCKKKMNINMSKQKKRFLEDLKPVGKKKDTNTSDSMQPIFPI